MGSGTEVNPAVLRRLRVLGPVSAIVYLFLLRESGVEAGEWFECSARKVTEGLELSDKPVRRALRYLEDLDIIEVDAAQNQSSLTRMRMVPFLPVDKSLSDPVDNYSAPVNSTGATPSSFHFDLTEEQVKPQVSIPAVVNSTGADDSGTYILDTGLFALGGSAEGGDVDYEKVIIDEWFARWWKAYPRAEAKQRAYAEFLKAVTRVEFAKILDGAERYAAHCRDQKLPTVSIAHPSTWLHQSRWTDKYAAPKKSDTFAAARGADYYSDC